MKVKNLVPDVYYHESRDFAAVGRLLEILYNYMKTSADCVNTDPSLIDADPNIVKLAADSLGFKMKHEYTTKDLAYVISDFTNLLRKKGSIEAIEEAIQLLLTSQGLKQFKNCEFIYDEYKKNTYELKIQVPKDIKDIVLLEDLFDYILPVGVIYHIVKVDDILPNRTTTISNESSKRHTLHTDVTLGSVTTIAPDTSDALIGTIGSSVVVSSAGTGSFESLTEEPADWKNNYKSYYKYNFETDKYVKLTTRPTTFEAYKYYKKIS